MKPIVISTAGCLVWAQYPDRKTTDLYVCPKGCLCFCAQCEEQFPVRLLKGHIHSHDRRSGEAELIMVKGGRLVRIKQFRKHPERRPEVKCRSEN